MSRYARHAGTRQTPQSQSIPGSDQVSNSAGGFVYKLDQWARLERFLILGAEGGTYYVSESKLSIDNCNTLLECLKSDGPRTVRTIVDISKAGRAPKSDPAIFALAVAAKKGDAVTRSAAFEALPEVCRTGTHLFQFIADAKAFGGWGRGQQRAVGRWYTDKDPDKLAYQLVKYRQRNGWTHRDVLRLAKPAAGNSSLLSFAVNKPLPEGLPIPELIQDFLLMQKATTEAEVVALLSRNPNLPWETIPSQFLKSVEVWGTLLPNLPVTALIRNLGRMTASGLLAPMSEAAKTAVSRLSDTDRLRRGRLHPMTILKGLRTYQKGAGIRGSLTWTAVPQIVDALDNAFYGAFDLIEPSGKNTLLGIDVSGSMSWGGLEGGILTPAEIAAAMAMVTARTESNYMIMGFADDFRDLKITANQRLTDVLRATSDMNFGRTDCALPMIWARENKIPVEVFGVYTDNETWAGHIHPSQALNSFREKMQIPAKQVVVGITATEFSIADPNDGGTLDVVGFDTAAPAVIADFSRN